MPNGNMPCVYHGLGSVKSPVPIADGSREFAARSRQLRGAIVRILVCSAMVALVGSSPVAAASLIEVAPSGEIVPTNPPQIPPPPTAEQIPTPPPPIAAPPPPKQLPPPPPPQEHAPAVAPAPGAGSGSGGEGSGGTGGGDGDDGPAEPLPPMPPGAVRLAP